VTAQGFGSALSARLFPDRDVAYLPPVEWVGERLGEFLWSRQRMIAESVERNRFTAVPSANGIGKSFTAARIAAWWVDTRPIGTAIVVATAPTERQIDAVLWAELRHAHDLGGLAGTVTRGEWRVGATLVGLARKSTDFIDAERAAASFQGIHRPYTLVILDEASGIPSWLWRAVAGLTTAATARVLAIGNPLTPAGRFAEVCKPGSGWNVLPVSALDSPNFSGEKVPRRVADALPSTEWVAEMARDYGEGSPAYQSRVLGEFPEQGDDGLVSAAWITAAHERTLTAEGPISLGVDVARSGSDETVAYRCQGGVCRLAHSAHGADTMATAGAVTALRAEEADCRAVIDESGLGSGVVDRLRELGQTVEGFNGAQKARRPDRFANRRAECFWHLREQLRTGLLDLDLADDLLASQLLAVRWQTNSRGLIQIESKDDLRKRGIASPDRADALSMALAPAVAEAQFFPTEPNVAASLTAGLLRPDGRPLTADIWERRW
jgi:hypothetical protein